MSFNELEPKVSGAAPKPAVRFGMFQSRGSTARPMIVIKGATLDQVFGAKAEKFRILLGAADDRHLLRIVADDRGGGRFKPTELGKAKGATFWRFLLASDSSRFPDRKIDLQEATFEADPKTRTMTITLPAWAWDDSRRRAVEAAPMQAKATKAVASKAATAVAAAAKPEAAPGAAGPTHANGITVSLVADEESISFAGKEMELTDRQAKVAAALAKASPHPVNRSKLVEAIWGARPPTSADQMLDTTISSLRQAVGNVGLKVDSFKGIGVAMRPA